MTCFDNKYSSFSNFVKVIIYRPREPNFLFEALIINSMNNLERAYR